MSRGRTRPKGWHLALAVIASCALLALSACSGEEPNTVSMVQGNRFEPDTITVEPGTTVTWVNRSQDAHTVTAYEDSLPEDVPYFSSGEFANERTARANLAEGLITSSETYEVTFEVPGTYRYFCIPHEATGMKGKVVVEE